MKGLWICHSRIEHTRHLNWHLTERNMYGKNRKRDSLVKTEKDKTKKKEQKHENWTNYLNVDTQKHFLLQQVERKIFKIAEKLIEVDLKIE